MRKIFLFPNLKTAIHSPCHSDTFWWLPSFWSYSHNKRIKFIEFLFQFLHKGLNSPSTEALCIRPLVSINRMPQQISYNDWTWVSWTRNVTWPCHRTDWRMFNITRLWFTSCRRWSRRLWWGCCALLYYSNRITITARMIRHRASLYCKRWSWKNKIIILYQVNGLISMLAFLTLRIFAIV